MPGLLFGGRGAGASREGPWVEAEVGRGTILASDLSKSAAWSRETKLGLAKPSPLGLREALLGLTGSHTPALVCVGGGATQLSGFCLA